MDFIAIMRWGWRQLTSMRTALILLILLGVLMLLGDMGYLVAWGLGHFDSFYDRLLNYM